VDDRRGGRYQANNEASLARSPLHLGESSGLIYDVLAVSPTSLKARKDDWMKVIKVWDRVVHPIKPRHRMTP
jgi:NitT/TauT family transport system substrate-binding protein